MAQHGEAGQYYQGGGNGYPMNPPQQDGQWQQQPQQQQQGYGYGAPQQGGYGAPPPQQQNYSGGMPPPPNYGQVYNGDQKPQFEEAFKIEKPKWNDLWAGILFILTCAGFVCCQRHFHPGLCCDQELQRWRHLRFSKRVWTDDKHHCAVHVVPRGGFCSGLWLCVVSGMLPAPCQIASDLLTTWQRKFTKQFIWITGILNIISCFVTAIYMLSRKYWSGGIIFLVFGIFTIICFISWIPRIPFSVLMLQTAIDVSKKYGHVYLVSFLSGLLAAAFGAWFSVTMVAVYVKYEPGNNPACSTAAGGCSSAKVIGLLVFITFAAYWITEWIKCATHVVISGVYGAWYFAPNNPAKGATRGAARRALTYSFGSISFGSLIVAIIQFLRQLCSVARNQAAADGNIVGQIGFCILGCLIGILNWAVEFINRYAFSYMALYGKSYIQSAKATWTMIKNRGMDALVNECLTGPVFTMGSTFVAYICAL
jgi:hypothetical protein